MNIVFVEKAIHRRAPRGGLQRFKGGQFIDRDLWEGEKKRAKDALPGLLSDFDAEMQFLRAVYEQNAAIERLPELRAQLASMVEIVKLSTIEARMKATIRNYYARAFLLGKRAAGNLTSATPEDLATLANVRKDEYVYLRAFLKAIRDQNGVMPYAERMNWYAMAAREIYNVGFVLGDAAPNRWVEWAMGPTEHCETCLKNSGVWRASALAAHIKKTGEVPQSGRLECRGYKCQCKLREAAAPEDGKGDHPE